MARSYKPGDACIVIRGSADVNAPAPGPRSSGSVNPFEGPAFVSSEDLVTTTKEAFCLSRVWRIIPGQIFDCGFA